MCCAEAVSVHEEDVSCAWIGWPEQGIERRWSRGWGGALRNAEGSGRYPAGSLTAGESLFSNHISTSCISPGNVV